MGWPVGILSVRNLSIRFGNHEVLRHVTFDLEGGQALAVIGPNGAGKTVLFKALIGSIPYDGTVTWAEGTRIGYVPQKLDIDRDVPITGMDFLQARAAVGEASSMTVAKALDLVALSTRAAQAPIGELSGGQFQRLLVAFALAGNPTVLLLDEATAGVDEPGQERLKELVHRLQDERGLTVLFISHELTVVSQYATHVLCLGCEPVSVGPPGEILTQATLERLYGSPVAFHFHDQDHHHHHDH